MAAKHEKSILVNAPLMLVVERLRYLPASGMKMTLQGECPYQNGAMFQIKHGVGMTSWGENITMVLLPVGADQTSVSIRSECVLPTQIIDWGQNKKNVENLIRYLS